MARDSAGIKMPVEWRLLKKCKKEYIGMEYKMIKKEINEIKSQYTLEECGILRLCGCYVNGDKEKVARFNQTFLNLPEEEKHKYFDIFRKTLSGTPGKNLLDMRFTMDSYADGGARTFLYQLRDSELKDDALLEKFYDKVIESYSHPGVQLSAVQYLSCIAFKTGTGIF